jgi:SAM-dependent methyltransferase
MDHRKPIPPPDLRFQQDDREFIQSGVDGVEKFRSVGLRAEHKVLDVGCGAGRHALALADFIDPRAGEYHGMDVRLDRIEWCRANISQEHPQFHFHHLDIRTERFSPGSSESITSVRFPFPDESFDFVIYWSVFTHMLPEGVEPYLRETVRVLKPAGIAFTTFYLWTPDTAAAVAGRPLRWPFPFDRGNYRVHSELEPELAVSYKEEFVDDVVARCGLSGTKQLGTWRAAREGSQDFVVLRKKM